MIRAMGCEMKNCIIDYISILKSKKMRHRDAGVDRFTIRVYGIWINEKKEVLVSDEWVAGRRITKFPGGGLEPGEGPAECVKREWQEELNVAIRIHSQFYFTDDFVASFLNDGRQVISLYYRVEVLEPLMVSIKKEAFDFEEDREGAQAFRFIPLTRIGPADFSLPIDRKVGEMLEKLNDTKPRC